MMYRTFIAEQLPGGPRQERSVYPLLPLFQGLGPDEHLIQADKAVFTLHAALDPHRFPVLCRDCGITR